MAPVSSTNRRLGNCTGGVRGLFLQQLVQDLEEVVGGEGVLELRRWHVDLLALHRPVFFQTVCVAKPT